MVSVFRGYSGYYRPVKYLFRGVDGNRHASFGVSMATQSYATIGSGTYVKTRLIIPSGLGGDGPSNARGDRYGTNVVVINPEDLNSSPAFATSGITVPNVSTAIWGPGISLLPTQRELVIRNYGPHDCEILTTNPAGSGFILPGDTDGGRAAYIRLPLLHNVDVYARSFGTTSQISILAFQ